MGKLRLSHTIMSCSIASGRILRWCLDVGKDVNTMVEQNNYIVQILFCIVFPSHHGASTVFPTPKWTLTPCGRWRLKFTQCTCVDPYGWKFHRDIVFALDILVFVVFGWGKLGPSIWPMICPENHMDWTDGLMQFAISNINALLDECLHTMCGLLDWVGRPLLDVIVHLQVVHCMFKSLFCLA